MSERKHHQRIINESHENPTLISNLSMDGDDEHDSGRDWEVVAPAARPSSASAASYGDDFSVFPPSLHEGLTPNLTLDSPSSSAEGLDENNKEEEATAEAECRVSRTRIAESARRLVESGIELIRSKIAGPRGGGGGGCGNGGAVWSVAAAAAGFAGVLMYMRRRHRRERELLLFLILEKDERINQLIDQIVKMSEVIATNYKVPVVTRT